MLPLKKTTYAFVGAIIILLAGGGIFFYGHSQIQKKIESVSILESELSMETQRRERSQSITHLVEDTAEKRNEMERYFVDESGVASFITDIETIAESAGVDEGITSVGVSNLKKDDPASEYLEEISIQVRAKGSWNEVFQFVRLIENMPVVSFVRDVSFDYKVAQEAASWNVTLSIQARKIKNDEQDS